MRKIVLWILLTGTVVFCFGQELPAITPVSPETASLLKFNEVAVSQYTGVADISVPIYNFSLDNFSLPIGLRYHNGGIRVNEQATSVGLGWNLIAGGQITRVMKDKPDDRSNGFMHTPHTIQTINGLQAYTTNDLEPDVFYLNVTNVASEFRFSQDRSNHSYGNILSFPLHNDIKIIPYFNSVKQITHWKVIDSKGHQYFFGLDAKSKEGITDSYSWVQRYITGVDLPSSSGLSYVTAWKLSKVITNTGGEILFDYDDRINYQEWGVADERLYNTSGSYLNSKTKTFRQDFLYSSRLKSISSNRGKITFTTQPNPREDKAAFKALEHIKVYDYNDRLVEDIRFDYDYFQSTTSINGLFVSGYPDYYQEISKRLKLLAINFLGSEAGASPVRTAFLYNETVNLPHRFSYAQDHWGYYNGKDYNNSLLPSGKLNPTLQLGGQGGCNASTGLPLDYQGADRSVDTLFTKANTLTKIVHPTKGVTSISYENNILGATTGTQSVSGPYENLYSKSDALFLLSNRTHTYTTAQAPVGTKYIYSDELTVDGLVLNQGAFDVSSINNVCTSVPGDLLGNCLIQFVVKKKLDQFGTYEELYRKNMPFKGQIQLSANATYVISIEITAANYNPSQLMPVVSSTIKWSEADCHIEGGETKCTLYAGGLRTSEIHYADAVSGEASKKVQYRYQGGWVLSPPIYTYYTHRSSSESCFLGTLSSSSVVPLVTTKGSNIGYTNVEESVVSGSERLKRTFIFDAYGYANQGNLFEVIYHNAKSWKSGNPIQTFSGDHVEVEDTNYYEENVNVLNGLHYSSNSLSIPAVVREPKAFSSSDLSNLINFSAYGGGGNFSNASYFKPITLRSGYKIIREKERELQNVSSKNEFVYDNFPEFSQVTEIRTTNSMGELILNKMYYADDVVNTSSLGLENLSAAELHAIDRLKKDDLHRIAEPVQTETYKDLDKDGIADADELLNVQRTNYSEFYSNRLLPKEIRILKGAYNSIDNSLEDRIIYHDYYVNGTVKELSKTGGTRIVYIWGYHQTQPIAKIENATFSDVAGYVSNLQSLSDADDDRTMGTLGNEGQLRTALNALRSVSALSNARITTFTYDPLVGVTSMTDPKGETIYYEYDGFNRLQYVKDKDGHILSENNYHYKN